MKQANNAQKKVWSTKSMVLKKYDPSKKKIEKSTKN